MMKTIKLIRLYVDHTATGLAGLSLAPFLVFLLFYSQLDKKCLLNQNLITNGAAVNVFFHFSSFLKHFGANILECE